MTSLTTFFLILFSIALFSGCSDYTTRTSRALLAFQNGDFERASQGYEKEKESKKDRLLYLIDKGMVLHTAAKYSEAIKVFQEAEDFSENIDFISLSNELASIFTNERIRTYKGEAFERILINVYKAIDYIMLGDIENALVECRRINLKIEKYNEILKTSQTDPFPRYVSGILFEANGDINDAYIDYKFTYRIDPSFYFLARDLLSLSKRLGFIDEYEDWAKIFGTKNSHFPSSKEASGELILIYECGKSPEKISTEMGAAAQVIPVPIYNDRPSQTSYAEIWIDEKLVSKTYLLSDIGRLSKEYLNRRVGEYVARGIARLAVKTGAAVAVGKYVDKDLGILVGLALLLTNRADLRSSLTLPENIQLARIQLKEGKYDIELRFRGKFGGYSINSKLFKDVEIKKGKKSFLNFRSFD
jgi:uncharacterized protein